MIINTMTTVAFKVPSEYKQAMKFMKEHPNWRDESDSNTWRYTNMQTFFTNGSLADAEPQGDLISRADAIERFCECGTSLERQGKTIITMIDAKYAFIKTLESLPSAEPKTGKWIKAMGMMPPEFHGHHYCSECGNFANMEPPFGNREDLSNFCLNCNADMRGENK